MSETGTTGDAPMSSPSAENLWEVFRMSKENWEQLTDEQRDGLCVLKTTMLVSNDQEAKAQQAQENTKKRRLQLEGHADLMPGMKRMKLGGDPRATRANKRDAKMSIESLETTAMSLSTHQEMLDRGHVWVRNAYFVPGKRVCKCWECATLDDWRYMQNEWVEDRPQKFQLADGTWDSDWHFVRGKKDNNYRKHTCSSCMAERSEQSHAECFREIVAGNKTLGSQGSCSKYYQRAADHKKACQVVKKSYKALVGFAFTEEGDLYLPALERSCEGVKVGVDAQSRGFLSPDDPFGNDMTSWSEQTWTWTDPADGCDDEQTWTWTDPADGCDDDRSTWSDKNSTCTSQWSETSEHGSESDGWRMVDKSKGQKVGVPSSSNLLKNLTKKQLRKLACAYATVHTADLTTLLRPLMALFAMKRFDVEESVKIADLCTDWLNTVRDASPAGGGGVQVNW
jgi:hypothetical protein